MSFDMYWNAILNEHVADVYTSKSLGFSAEFLSAAETDLCVDGCVWGGGGGGWLWVCAMNG